jgi:hypothetical protein
MKTTRSSQISSSVSAPTRRRVGGRDQSVHQRRIPGRIGAARPQDVVGDLARVPRTVVIEQSKRRWWQGRHSRHTKFGVELGGRYISEAALNEFHSGPRTASTCAANARKLYRTANKAGIESESDHPQPRHHRCGIQGPADT